MRYGFCAVLTLLLLRHAKAVQYGRGNDIARALTERGERDATALGAFAAAKALLPDIALASASVRTRQTFECFVRGAATAIPARFEESLYNATAAQLRDVLRLVDPQQRVLMIVGHNPGIMEVAGLLARDGDTAEIERLQNRFPPCTLAVIQFDLDDWAEARVRGGRLDLLLMPDDLSSA